VRRPFVHGGTTRDGRCTAAETNIDTTYIPPQDSSGLCRADVLRAPAAGLDGPDTATDDVTEQARRVAPRQLSDEEAELTLLRELERAGY
jgi:hypothetical protein